MPSMTSSEREDFLRRDRERLHRIAIGESASTARLRAYETPSWEHDAEGQSGPAGGRGRAGFDDDVNGDEEEEDLDESEPEPLNLPESTHSLLFTQPVCSVPFGFASFIILISIMCLIMAYADNSDLDLSRNNPLGVPANVSSAVQIAKYMGILIVLLMEEEIPTGVYLLRMIPKSSFKKKFPNRSYCRFVISALVRILIGYTFLVNVLVILLKAEGVLDIFYDVLALQFISELDDIAFALCKLEVLGKTLKRACTAKLFQTEFEKQSFQKTKKASIFLKSVYVINLALFLTPMIMMSKNQADGYYQCKRIKVDFGDAVWGEALRETEGNLEEKTLAFSSFNGIYENVGTQFGRPIYQETRKFDNLKFGEDAYFDPAEIKYSSDLDAWTFSQPHIRKKRDQDDKSEPWLLRSPETEEYDLLNVGRDWQIWFGVIDTTRVSYTCTECGSDTDCNLNGKCNENRQCDCNVETETTYLGPHCEVALKDKCKTIVADAVNQSWSILRYSAEPGQPPDTLFQEYNRPVYVNVGGIPDAKEDDINWLIYTGSRWKYVGLNLGDMNITQEELYWGIRNYHAFWSGAFTYNPSDELNLISDPTTGDNPVGVDWFLVTDWGDQFGPFGALVPVQEYPGHGIFRCAGYFIPPNAAPNATEQTVTNITEVSGAGFAEDGRNITEVNVTEVAEGEGRNSTEA